MNRIFFTMFLFWICGAMTTLGQTQTWDLQSCIDYAVQNNLQLKQSALQVRGNEANLEQSRMARLPNLNGSASHSYNSGRSIDPFTNQFITDVIQSNSFGLSAGFTVFNGFQLRNTIKQNQLNVQSSQLDVKQAENDLKLNIAGAYLNILLNQELVENARIQLQTTEAQIDRTRKLIAAGALPEASIYDLLSQKATNQQQLVSAENGVMLATLSLRQLLQLPPDEPFAIEKPTLPEIPAEISLPSTQSIYDIAEGNQPNVKSADLNIESAALGISIAEANRYPTVSLNGSMFTNYSSAQDQFFEGDGTTQTILTPIGFLQNDPTQVVVAEREFPNGEIIDFGFLRQMQESFRQNIGINVQIPIFNRGQINNAIQQAEINLDRNRLRADIVRNQLRQTIEQAYVDVRAAQATYLASQERATALEQSLNVTEKQFRAGAANSVDYNIAQTQLNGAKTDVLRAKYDFIFRQKILDFYQGKEITLD